MIAFKMLPFLLLPILLIVAGCAPGAPKPVPVAGTVLIDGKPLTSGFIRLIPADNRAATGAIDDQGRFRLTTMTEGDGCVPGTHDVEVTSTKTIRHGELAWLAPEKYRDPKRSGLKATITGPTDDLVIELSWEGQKPFVEKIDTTGGDFDPRSIR
jgi:hypothetical protein